MVDATKDDDGTANWNAAALLAQLTWWCSPSERTGRIRATHRHGDEFWLVRADDEWAEELGVSAKTMSRLRRRLAGRQLVECKRMSDKGRPVMHWRRLYPPDQVDEKSSQSADQVDQVSTSEVDQVSGQSAFSPLAVEKRNKTEVPNGAREESESRFDAHFWPEYPARDGKKLEKAKALAEWLKLPIEAQRAAVKGARHYAASGQRAKDAYRWLRDRCFDDWQTPATLSTNGNGGSRNAGHEGNMAELRELLDHARN